MPVINKHESEQGSSMDHHQGGVAAKSIENAVGAMKSFPHKSEAPPPPEIKLSQDRASSNGQEDEEEEAENHTMTRMLEDGTGRLCMRVQIFTPELICPSPSFY